MALIDDVFGGVPAPLLNTWGYDMTYVKAATTETYDPTTGTISGTETSVTVKGIIMKLDPKEFRGEFQTNDMKVVIDVESFRGASAILHNLIVRPQ